MATKVARGATVFVGFFFVCFLFVFFVVVVVVFFLFFLTKTAKNTKNSIKLTALQRVQLTMSVTASDLRTFLFPVFGFCYLEDICIIKETKELCRQKR